MFYKHENVAKILYKILIEKLRNSKILKFVLSFKEKFIKPFEKL